MNKTPENPFRYWDKENLNKLYYLKNLDGLSFDNLIKLSVDYAIAHGLLMRDRSNAGDEKPLKHAPFTLLPSPFPRELFTRCLKLQKIVNKLIDKLSMDDDLIRDVFERLGKLDEFQGRLYDIWKKVQEVLSSKQKIILN